MEVERFSSVKKLLTIEVNLRTRAIVQIRGKITAYLMRKSKALSVDGPPKQI